MCAYMYVPMCAFHAEAHMCFAHMFCMYSTVYVFYIITSTQLYILFAHFYFLFIVLGTHVHVLHLQHCKCVLN